MGGIPTVRLMAFAALLVFTDQSSVAATVEEVVDLRVGSGDAVSLLEEEPVTTEEKQDHSKYVAIRSDDYDTQAGHKPEYHIRHLGKSVVLTTLSGPTDKKNGAWYLHRALCPPGTKSSTTGDCPATPADAKGCVSLEAADHEGAFLAVDTQSDLVVLREYESIGANMASATFCMMDSKTNSTHVSYAALGREGFFLTHTDFKLQLCNNEPTSKCGTHVKFEDKTSFEQLPALFLGRCTRQEGGKERCRCLKNAVGKDCDLTCPGGCGPGSCVIEDIMKGGREAKCNCESGYVGPQCGKRCPINKVTQTACGNRGTCELNTVSKPEADQKPFCKCNAGFKGDACELHCPAYNAKQNTVCSGHGKCSINTGIVEVGAMKTTCNCSTGFIGARCDIKCPTSPKGAVCSNFGKCILNEEKGNAECVCNKGYGGKACQFKCPTDAAGNVCSSSGKCMEGNGGVLCACQSGYAGPACEVKCPGMTPSLGTEDQGCSGHGRCSFVSERVIHELSQNATNGSNTGNATNGSNTGNVSNTQQVALKPVCTCIKGFGSEDCSKQCPTNKNGEICSGRGKCNKEGKCVCDIGHVGPGCQGECPSSLANGPCNSNGECMWDFDAGLAICKCQEGFLGAACKEACPRGGSDMHVCSAKGGCVSQRGAAACVCQDGFIGDACHLACPGAHSQEVCNKKGRCTTDTSQTKAICSCNNGFLGNNCQQQCPGLMEDGTVCSGHGICAAGKGPNFRPTCACTKGFLGDACDIKCPVDSYGNVCAGAGECQVKKYEDGVEGSECICPAGRVNFNCDTECPMNTQDGTVCSGHGKCEIRQKSDTYGNLRLDAVCKCLPNYLGEDCFHGCPVDAEQKQCSGHGECLLQAGGAFCSCANGWSGNKCDERVCGSNKSFFNTDISKCTCEAGFTCCSRESGNKDKERDTTIQLLNRENSLMRGKVMAAKKQLTN